MVHVPMEFFDCNCWFGVVEKPPLAPAPTPEVVLEAMDRVGIARALVRHAAIFAETPEVGNALTSHACAGSERLVPSWGILPPQTRELGGVGEFIDAMRRAGVRALWAYPAVHRYLLNTTTMGGLLEEMEARGIPLFLTRRGSVEGDQVFRVADEVLADFPTLHLIVVGHGSWGEDRFFRPLMERYDNFGVDTSRYELDGGIEAICQTYGPERLYFGTQFPETPPGAALLTLLHADISDEDKALIAGGNLARLLEEVRL